MTLSGTTRIGPYEILSPIGSGGMGEVYKARDPRLGREVAIKILPASYAASDERLARFEQEARAAGQLNHPNVVAVYDIGTYEGAPFVVTELLEGETLRDKLRAGPLAPRKALEYAAQIARGLSAAHDKGIIHRDIKPDNLFVTRDGRVKILDFGLAKVDTTLMSGGVDSEVATLLARTNPGVVMGTVGYMSPEQVRGVAVDHRSDIFSFGTVLYEMLTGSRAFTGDSAVEVMNSILKEEPADLASVTGAMPPGVDRVVRHCLEKHPEDRFQATSDLAFDLEALSLYSGPSFLTSGAATRVKRAFPAKAVALGLGALLLSAVAFLAGSASNEPEPAARARFSQLTFRKGDVSSARFAPDGQTIIYTAAWDGMPPETFLVRSGSPESRSFDLPNSHILSVSPSGELAVQHNKVLARMSFTGGAPREILEDVITADWSPSGSELAVVHVVDGKYRLEYPIGKVIHVSDGPLDSLRFSRDGRQLAFTHHPIPGDDRGTVMLSDLDGNVRQISDPWTSLGGLAWSPDGDELFLAGTTTGANRAIWALGLDGSRRLIADTAGSFALHDVARDGRMLLTRNAAQSEVLGNTPGEEGERNLSWLDGSVVADLSDDGKQLLFSEQIHGGGANYSVYLRNTSGSPPVRLGDGSATSLSPDGRWALAIIPSSPPRLMMLPTGAGEPRPLVESGFEQIGFARWFPDGKRILLAAVESGQLGRCYILDAATRALTPLTPDGVRGSLISPDGNSVAVIDFEHGEWKLWPLAGGEAVKIPGIIPGDVPIRWSLDGKSLFVREAKQWPLRVQRIAIATGMRELVRETQPADMTGVGPYPGRVVITPDGATYAYSYARHLSELYLVEEIG
jgi:serine/threonine protein kinase